MQPRVRCVCVIVKRAKVRRMRVCPQGFYVAATALDAATPPAWMHAAAALSNE
jgi:hypothetical protein